MNAFLSDESEHSRAQAPSARKPSSRPQEKIYGFAMREAKGLFIWSLTAYTLRMGFSYLTALSLMRSEGERSGDPHNFCSLSGSHGADAILCGSGTNADASQVGVLGMVLEGSLTICTVLAGWALSILPSKVAKLTFSGDGSAPGFSFASTW